MTGFQTTSLLCSTLFIIIHSVIELFLRFYIFLVLHNVMRKFSSTPLLQASEKEIMKGWLTKVRLINQINFSPRVLHTQVYLLAEWTSFKDINIHARL